MTIAVCKLDVQLQRSAEHPRADGAGMAPFEG